MHKHGLHKSVSTFQRKNFATNSKYSEIIVIILRPNNSFRFMQFNSRINFFFLFETAPKAIEMTQIWRKKCECRRRARKMSFLRRKNDVHWIWKLNSFQLHNWRSEKCTRKAWRRRTYGVRIYNTHTQTHTQQIRLLLLFYEVFQTLPSVIIYYRLASPFIVYSSLCKPQMWTFEKIKSVRRVKKTQFGWKQKGGCCCRHKRGKKINWDNIKRGKQKTKKKNEVK